MADGATGTTTTSNTGFSDTFGAGRFFTDFPGSDFQTVFGSTSFDWKVGVINLVHGQSTALNFVQFAPHAGAFHMAMFWEETNLANTAQINVTLGNVMSPGGVGCLGSQTFLAQDVSYNTTKRISRTLQGKECLRVTFTGTYIPSASRNVYYAAYMYDGTVR